MDVQHSTWKFLHWYLFLSISSRIRHKKFTSILTWIWNSSQIFLKSGCSLACGIFTCTLARIPVPRLVGHEERLPRESSCWKPISLSSSLTALHKRPNTDLMSLPFSMLIILRWSSSFTHTRNVLFSLWKIPRPWGHILLMPAASKKRSPFLNRKWSSTSFFRVSSLIPVRG